MKRFRAVKSRASVFIFSILLFGVSTMNENIAAQTKNETRSTDGASSVGKSRRSDPMTIVFELTNNHIYLKVRINDSAAPLWFLLDTGAGASIIDLERAKVLGLTLEGQVQTGGAGANAPTGAFVKGASLAVEGVKDFALPLPLAIPFNHLSPYEGRSLDGILGHDLISRFVVEIDYQKRQITLHDKAKYEYRGAGETVPLTFKLNHPHARVGVKQYGSSAAVEGDFVIDLGSRLPVALTRPFVEKNGLLQSAAKTIKAPVAGAGVGGESKASVGRLESVSLGRTIIKNPLASFSQDEKGVFATAQYFEGNIGGEILRRFKVIFDYSRSRMILERAAQTGEPYEYDMSGIFLVAEGADFKTFKIRHVADDSPASEAGLREGDVIDSIDNRPAAEFELERIRQMFKRDGREYELTVKRNSERLKIKVKMRKLI